LIPAAVLSGLPDPLSPAGVGAAKLSVPQEPRDGKANEKPQGHGPALLVGKLQDTLHGMGRGGTVSTDTKWEDGQAGGQADGGQDGHQQREQGLVGSAPPTQREREARGGSLCRTDMPPPGSRPTVPRTPASLQEHHRERSGLDPGWREPDRSPSEATGRGATGSGESCGREGSRLSTGREALDPGRSLPIFGIAALNFVKC